MRDSTLLSIYIITLWYDTLENKPHDLHQEQIPHLFQLLISLAKNQTWNRKVK